MDFILDKAEVSDENYIEDSDCSEDESLLEDFIESDNKCEIDLATFYRTFDNARSFQNQQKNANEEINREEERFFGEDGQPEMFSPENINDVEFHDFADYKKGSAI